MSQLFLLVCSLSALSFLLTAEDPMSMGFGLGFYSLFVSLLMAESYFSYFAFLLFFVYVGTLMVMFLMVVSLAPNPLFRITPILTFAFFFTACNMMDDLLRPIEEDKAYQWSGGVDVWGYVDDPEQSRFVEWSDLWISGVYEKLGEFSGPLWGTTLVTLGLVLLLSITSVVNMCKRCSGPLVRWVYKSDLTGRWKFRPQYTHPTYPDWKVKKMKGKTDEWEEEMKKKRQMEKRRSMC